MYLVWRMLLVVVNKPATRTVLCLLTVHEVIVDDNRKLRVISDFLVLETVEHVQLHKDDAFRLSAGLACRV